MYRSGRGVYGDVVIESGMDYSTVTLEYNNRYIAGGDLEYCNSFMELQNVVDMLKRGERCICSFSVDEGAGVRAKQVEYLMLDSESNIIGEVRTDFTDAQQKQIEQENRLREALDQADEANEAKSEFLSRMIGIAEITDPADPSLISVFPYPEVPEGYTHGTNFNIVDGVRIPFGPHNIFDAIHGDVYEHRDDRVYCCHFGAGLRIYDVSDPFVPKEIAYFMDLPLSIIITLIAEALSGSLTLQNTIMSAARTPPRSDTAAIPDITAIPAKAIIPAAVPPDAPVKEYVIRTAAMTAATKKIPVLSVLTFMPSVCGESPQGA